MPPDEEEQDSSKKEAINHGAISLGEGPASQSVRTVLVWLKKATRARRRKPTSPPWLPFKDGQGLQMAAGATKTGGRKRKKRSKSYPHWYQIAY